MVTVSAKAQNSNSEGMGTLRSGIRTRETSLTAFRSYSRTKSSTTQWVKVSVLTRKSALRSRSSSRLKMKRRSITKRRREKSFRISTLTSCSTRLMVSRSRGMQSHSMNVDGSQTKKRKILQPLDMAEARIYLHSHHRPNIGNATMTKTMLKIMTSDFNLS